MREHGLFALADKAYQGLFEKMSYMLRKSGICLPLYLNVPPAEVADLAGHTVEMLPKVYDKVIRSLASQWWAGVEKCFKQRG